VKTIRYTLRHLERRPRKVSWSLVSGTWMKVSNGSWDLQEEDGERTRASYTVEVQIARPPLVPQALVDRISDELTRVQLPRTLDAFKTRAERGTRG
jgi:coenzyme Q-binding protein COQ10